MVLHSESESGAAKWHLLSQTARQGAPLEFDVKVKVKDASIP